MGLLSRGRLSIDKAVHRLIALLYLGKSIEARSPIKHLRNAEVIEHYQNGYTLFEIAAKFDISLQRAYQILHGRRK